MRLNFSIGDGNPFRLIHIEELQMLADYLVTRKFEHVAGLIQTLQNVSSRGKPEPETESDKSEESEEGWLTHAKVKTTE